MNGPTKSVDIVVSAEAEADAIWQVLADFGGFLKWAGDGDIRVDGEGVGMVRHLSMGVGKIAEQLTECDAVSKTLSYRLVEGAPLGMQDYSAQVQVLSVGAGMSELIWHGEFTAPDESVAQIADMLQSAYTGMTTSLVSYVNN